MRIKRIGCLLLSFILLVVMIQVPGSPAFAKDKDTSSPVVMTDTIKVDKTTAEREETVTISLKLQDESEIALILLKHIGSKSRFLKMKFDNIPNIDDSSIAFKTDGKIDAHTNSVCYNDLQYEKAFFQRKRIAL